MSIMRRFDLWAAKRLFFPPIVRACQALGWDQFVFAGYALVLGAIWFCAGVLTSEAPIWMKALISVVALCVVAVIGYTGRALVNPRPFWRAFAWCFLITDIIEVIVRGELHAKFGVMAWLAMLFYEYAIMIDRIPPLDSEEEVAPRPAEAGI